MESFSLHSLSATTTTIPSSFSRAGGASSEKPLCHVKLFKHLDSNFLRYPFSSTTTRATKHTIPTIRAQASGSTQSSSGTSEGISERTDSKDDNLVFVAGATGRVGSRTVRELIKLGFRVRAAVRNAQRAGPLVQSVEQMKLDGDATSGSGGSTAVEKLEIVECDLEKPDQIGSALGNASTVICAIGASEKEVFDITGPFRIDFQATKNLIDAATVAKVNHFILVTSLGTNKIGFPAAILNLFWGVLVWKRKAEEALLASGLPYTIVRPGGMERPTDAFKETHNLTLSTEDTLFGGLVSNLQVAELMAVMVKNRNLSYCKVVEVVAETTAPLTPAEELLAKIPSQRPYIPPSKKPDVPSVCDPVPSASVVAEEPKETAQPKPVAKQILSPYSAYEDLKPPSSPSPSQPSTAKQTTISETVPPPSGPDSTSATSGVDGISQTTSPSKGREFLSPYVAYEDLKPPSSPSPSQPSIAKQTAISETVPLPSASDTTSATPGIDDISQTTSLSKGKEFLSPYAAYEDLKPPTSPTPTPSSSNDKPLTAPKPVESASSSSIEDNVAKKDPPQDPISCNSPYPVYADFKPPTSPSPSAPSVSPSISQIDKVSSNGPAQIPAAEKADDGKQHIPKPKSRPLSPYTMYEELKPPASPSPTFRN